MVRVLDIKWFFEGLELSAYYCKYLRLSFKPLEGLPLINDNVYTF